MRRLCAALLFALLALLTGASNVAAQLSVSGSPPLLRISAAAAGSQPTSVTNSTTTYTITAITLFALKVTGQLNAAMPTGMTLTATLAAPPGATSAGAVQLDATARDLVTNIVLLSIATRSITYQLKATPAAGVVPTQSRTVTLTLTAAP